MPILVLVARTREKLDVVAADVEAAGGSAHVVPAGLSEPEEVDGVVKEVLDRHGHVDVLVCNAARSIRRGVLATADRLHDLDRIMALNFFGTVRLALGLVPSMVQHGGGQVVVVSTIGTLLHVPRFGAYLASKSAIEQYGRVLGTELRPPHGVDVSVVHMPLWRTEMIAPSKVWRRPRRRLVAGGHCSVAPVPAPGSTRPRVRSIGEPRPRGATRWRP